ncbi:MAG: serine/threonine protein kinase [Muribaculaceae bacterium]|nr:serine/threonine protein kinase [Muribaculaceae bacterium]
MIQPESPESGYIGPEESGCYIGSEMRDVEILHITSTNIIARGRRYGRQWFIKGLREELRDSTSMRRQLLKEFEINSRLRHPAVVEAVGLEEIEGIGLCMVQEWIEGKTLGEVLKKGTLKPTERKRIMLRLTEAVAYLQSRGVVHRDLKPANVMIRDIGSDIVVTDFGLADTSDYMEWKQPAGTSGYISPEQEESGGADPADDVYSLGVMMREIAPGYKRIADRCTGRLSRRPEDAEALLKLLKHRIRRPKIISIAVAATVLSLTAVLAVVRINSLENAADDNQRNLTALAEKNASNSALVTALRDSLGDLRGKLSNTERELSRVAEYENHRQNLLKEGFSRIDRILRTYDVRISKISADDRQEFGRLHSELLRRLGEDVEDYYSTINKSVLSDEDMDRLRGDLYNYSALKQHEYQNKWMKIYYPGI